MTNGSIQDTIDDKSIKVEEQVQKTEEMVPDLWSSRKEFMLLTLLLTIVLTNSPIYPTKINLDTTPTLFTTSQFVNYSVDKFT